MLITRLRDGALCYEDSWSALRRAWQAAPPADRVVFDATMDPERRPAVRLPGTDAHDRPSYQTVPGAIWAEIRRSQRDRTQSLLVPVSHPRRARLCSQCGAVLTLARELAGVWTFRCETCRAVEVLGKDQVGGTVGAGEAEPR